MVSPSQLPPKCRANSSRDSRSPSSVSATDFALLLGSAMYPLACSRSRASQSCPFHARPSPGLRQPQQRQNHLVHLLTVVLHAHALRWKTILAPPSVAVVALRFSSRTEEQTCSS